MTYDPERHHRHSIRLKGYDYTQAGTYFVTLGTREQECLFGSVVDGEVVLNAFGRIVQEEWIRSAGIREEIRLDEFVVMPNHLHGIVIITEAGSSMGFPMGMHKSVGKRHSVGAHGRAPLQIR